MTLIKSSFIIAVSTLGSRILGLFRELLIALLFGSTAIADSVNVAFKLPNLFRRIFAEGAFLTVFIPQFNEKLSKSNEEAKIYAQNILSVLAISVFITVVIIQIFTPQIMIILSPGFINDPAKFKMTVALSRITLPYLFFISLVTFYGGILNSFGRYLAHALSPIIMNLVIIFFTLICHKSGLLSAEIAISCSVICAGILQLYMIYIFSKDIPIWFKFKIRVPVFNADMKKFLKRMGPAVLNSGVGQINLFISQSIASFIPGAVSILSYADRIYQFPLSLIGVTFGVILLPTLSKKIKNHQIEEANHIQSQALFLGIVISLPCTFGIMALSAEIIHIIYERGAFTSHDTYLTSQALIYYVIALPSFILNKILTPSFYARDDIKTPLYITLFTISLNIILNIIFMNFYGAIGIALSFSIASWINSLITLYYAKRFKFFTFENKIQLALCKSFLISFFMGMILYLLEENYIHTASKSSTLIKALCLFFDISFGILFYFVLSLLTNLFSLKEFKQLIKELR